MEKDEEAERMDAITEGNSPQRFGSYDLQLSCSDMPHTKASRASPLGIETDFVDRLDSVGNSSQKKS